MPGFRSRLKRVVVAGLRGCLFYGSLAFVAHVVTRNLGSLPAGVWSVRFLLVITVLGVLYGMLIILIAVAWGSFLRALGVVASWPEIIVVYGRTNLAKYLPGNVFHFAGRQLVGRDHGWSEFAIFSSTVFEISLVVLAATLVTTILFAIVPLEHIPIAGTISMVSVAVLAGFVIGALVLIFGRRFLPFRATVERIMALVRSPAVPISLLLYLVFFCAMGGITVAMLYGLNGRWACSLFQQFTVTYTAAWLIGYISPGAPGGIGVREAALVALLGPSLGEGTAVSVACGLRCVTILGDLLLFAACQCLALSRQTRRRSLL